MISKDNKECLKCGFIGNDLESKQCLICSNSLEFDTSSPKKISQLTSLSDNWSISYLAIMFVGVFFTLGGIIKLFDFRSTEVNKSNKSLQPHTSMVNVENGEIPQGTFNYGGAICSAALMREGLHQKVEEAYPKIKLKYVEPKGNPGCSAELEPLFNQELSFVYTTRSMSQNERQLAIDRNLKLGLTPIAIDGVVAYTNKNNTKDSLSLSQLKAIYRGEVTNWQEIGGQDIPITVVSLSPESNTDLELVMNSSTDLTQRAEIVRDYTTAIRKVSQVPGAISLASTAILKGQSSIRPIALSKNVGTSSTPPIAALLNDGRVNLQAFEQGSYPLTRKLFLIFRQDGTADERAAVAYLNFIFSQQGQNIVNQAGFVPVPLDPTLRRKQEK